MKHYELHLYSLRPLQPVLQTQIYRDNEATTNTLTNKYTNSECQLASQVVSVCAVQLEGD